MVQDWGNFAVIVGSASGALTGLLFVAVSLNRDRISSHALLRGQATQTLILFMLPLLLSVLLVMPGLSATALGGWLIALAFMAGAALVRAGGRAKPAGTDVEDRLAQLIDRVSPNLLAVLLIVLAGCLLLAGDDGLYWTAVSAVISLIGGVINAWLFLIR